MRALSDFDPLDIAIGAAIRHRRQQLGLSQAALGKCCGISFQQLQKYEKGCNRIAVSRLAQIARALDCRIADLVGDIDAAEGLADERIEAFDLMRAKGAVQMLRGYARLPQDHQRAVLQLVKTLAVEDGADRPVVVSLFPASRR